MQKIMLLVLLCSINQTLRAQDDASDKVFNLPGENLRKEIWVDLGKGNRMQLQFDAMEDISRLRNLDSLVRVFISNLKPLKDSLTDELMSYRIDYLIETTEHKKLRIQRFAPKGNSYTVNDGEVAALKLAQDTIIMIGKIDFIAKYTMRAPFNSSRYYRVRFLLNNVHELGDYLNGMLNNKMATLLSNQNRWEESRNHYYHVKGDTSIRSKFPRGARMGGDFLNIRVSANIQNYKQYFVPSMSLSLGVLLSQNGHFKRDIAVSWDPNFLFTRNTQGKLITHRNDFLTLTWGQGPIAENDPRKESKFLFIASYSYLIHRSGETFTPHTQRLGMGRVSFFEGKTKLEPMIYFDRLFKGVTPGLRLIQHF
jgi:hypothetical protein